MALAWLRCDPEGLAEQGFWFDHNTHCRKTIGLIAVIKDNEVGAD